MKYDYRNNPWEYAMRQEWEEKKREDLRRIQKVAGAVLLSSFLVGWGIVLLAAMFS